MHLAIDTSATASAALISNGIVLAETSTQDTRSHSEVSVPQVAAVLAEAGVGPERLDGIFVSVGPGPFTGLRVGIAEARVLSDVWGVPLYGVMAHYALAWDVMASGHSAPFLIVTDARRREVYWSAFSAEGTLLDGPHVSAPTEVPSSYAHYRAFGFGAGLYPDAFHVDPDFAHRQPGAASLGRYGQGALAAGIALPGTEPLYLRDSDAKIPAARKLGGKA